MAFTGGGGGGGGMGGAIGSAEAARSTIDGAGEASVGEAAGSDVGPGRATGDGGVRACIA